MKRTCRVGANGLAAIAALVFFSPPHFFGSNLQSGLTVQMLLVGLFGGGAVVCWHFGRA